MKLYWKKYQTHMQLPTLCLCLELLLLFLIQAIDLPDRPLRIATHLINILLIGTLGWLAIAFVRSCYTNYTEKVEQRERGVYVRSSLFTQILFLYRLIIFVICTATFAAILLTFPYIKNVGIGILGSAGIVGIAIGIAARPILLNLMAGFQIAATKMIMIGDSLFIEGESTSVESIHLTHVILRTWDLRRYIVPISYFIDKPFQNWDAINSEIFGAIFLYCDYSISIDALRKKVGEIVDVSIYWNRKSWGVQVTNCTPQVIEIRVSASTDNAKSAAELKTLLREKLIDYIQKECPNALPCIRNYNR